ncbi:Uncharacterised protein [Paucimonas lemoignei]|jgi:hypothetical protein|nr:Uncharacterised protein [Paucimonas lemoignei]
MNYVGIHLDQCRVVPFAWHCTWLVVVSGDGPNFCGHALLKAGNFYFHIAGPFNRPYYMTESGYRRYITEGGKREIFRRLVPLSNPEGAQQKLEELSVGRWLWLGVPNNCVSYVEEIFNAGGANEAILSNCPTRWQ